MTRIRLYGAFTKVEEQPDGTLYVEGVASSEAVDADGETIRASAIKDAIPDYMKFNGTGPLREMHQLKAAGRTLSADVGKDGKTRIGAKVVDPVAVTKVREGVYVGFSVGGKVVKRNSDDPTVIEEMTLTEISLVDRPANPDAVIQLWKADAMPPEKTPFVQLCALVEKFKKGELQIDDAEKRALDVLGKAGGRTTVRKGMWQVARAAELFDGLEMLEESCEWEAEAEGDGSEVASLFAAAMREFAVAMRALLDEELSEALAGEDSEKVAGAATKAGSLAKAAGLAAKKVAALVKAKPHAVLSDEHKDDLAEAHGHVVEAHKRVGKVHKRFQGLKDDADAEAHKDAVDAVKDDVAECHKRLGKARKCFEGMNYKDAAAMPGEGEGSIVKTEKKPEVTWTARTMPNVDAQPVSDLERAVREVDADMKDRLAKAQADLETARKAQEASHQALQQSLQLREDIEKRAKENDDEAKKVADFIASLEKRYSDQITKVTTEAAETRKAAELANETAKKTNELNERLVEELAKRPKGALRAVPVNKADDNGTGKIDGPKSDEDLQKAAMDEKRSDSERAAARLELTKRAQARPIQR